MSSVTAGPNTSATEVTNISRHGLWIIVDDKEFFLPYDQFPWFKKASIEAVLNLECPQPHHLYWPDLDIDLTVESIQHPDRFPLKSFPTK